MPFVVTLDVLYTADDSTISSLLLVVVVVY